MKERMKKMLYNLYKGIENAIVDSNDQLYYIDLLIANSEFVDEVLSSEWFISNKYNSKNTFKVNFEFADGIVKPYIYDGDGGKRYITYLGKKNITDQKYTNVDFPKNSSEQNATIAKKAMKSLLPEQTEFVSTPFTKDMLEDYSEKSYKVNDGRLFPVYLPKSYVGFDGDIVIVPTWLAKKLSF